VGGSSRSSRSRPADRWQGLPREALLSATSTAVLIYRERRQQPSGLLRTTRRRPLRPATTCSSCGDQCGRQRGDRTVTMDSTAATDYGFGNTAILALPLHQQGGRSPTGSARPLRAPDLRHMVVYSGGTLNIGTTGTPIPVPRRPCWSSTPRTRPSRTELWPEPAQPCDLHGAGASRTVGKNIYYCCSTPTRLSRRRRSGGHGYRMAER